MSDTREEFESWFAGGGRGVHAFLSGRDVENEDTKEIEKGFVKDLLLTELFLLHEAGEVAIPSSLRHFPDLETDVDFRLELWCEAWGYADSAGKNFSEFLQVVPDDLKDAVADEYTAVAKLDSETTRLALDDSPPSLERYRVETEIGRGVFGVVYRAWDKQLERSVALKVLFGAGNGESQFAEARLIAALEHPGIISVFDCGIDDKNRAYLVTSLAEGQTLDVWLEARRSTDSRDPTSNTETERVADSGTETQLREVLELFVKICEALHAAHQRGVVHRDLKPSNIVVRPDNRPCILDFGLAVGGWAAGRPGELVGTPAYMSPEQARGEAHLVDARSDLFSLGILLFESLAGSRPWKSKSSRELVREVAHGSVRTLRQIEQSLPIALERICSKATAQSMSQRYGAAADLAEDLRWFLNSERPNSAFETSNASLVPTRHLKPYGPEDSHTFWQLLPGSRDVTGMPDLIRWWVERIHGEQERRNSVLVLHGPSGSGKSSLLRAGVLPHLERAKVRWVSLDAAEFASSVQFAKQISDSVGLPEPHPEILRDVVAKLRDSTSKPVTIAIDQFEQVLTWKETQAEEVTWALRQADGKNVQFVLVVRDEFWSETSSLMRQLDTSLRDDRNAMAVEPFSKAHAIRVLGLWAQAAGQDVSDDFLQAAVASVADNDQVVPVRLALLATVLGEEVWSHNRLDAISEQGSICGSYLESWLDRSPTPARRRFAEPARNLLSELVPAAGKLRGPAKGSSELKKIVGCADQDFRDLVDLLDRQLHVITSVGRDSATVSNAKETKASPSDHVDASYNLPHDFLVNELRGWLHSTRRRTASGRAQLDLEVAADRWAEQKETRNLAGPVDCVRFTTLTKPTGEDQTAFVRHSARRQLGFSMAFLVVACAALLGTQWVLGRARGNATVDRLVDSSVEQLPSVIRAVREDWGWTKQPLLQRLDSHTGASKNTEAVSDFTPSEDVASAARDRLSLAALEKSPEETIYLRKRVLEAEPDLVLLILQRLREDIDEAKLGETVEFFAGNASSSSLPIEQRLRSALAVGRLDSSHKLWTEACDEVCADLVSANPTQLGWLAEGFYPVRAKLTPGLRRIYLDSQVADLRTTTYLLAEFTADDYLTLVDILGEATLPQLPAIAPRVREAGKEMDTLLASRLKKLVAKWMEIGQEIQELEDGTSANRRRNLAERDVILARGIGNIASLLLQRGHSEQVLPLLTQTPDATIRSYIIHCYAACDGQGAPLLEFRNTASDVQSAVLQILGSLPPSSNVPIQATEWAKERYLDSDDLELHATAEWFLRGRGVSISELNKQRFVNKRAAVDPDAAPCFYLSSQRHLMVRVPGGRRATVGASPLDTNGLANETRHEVTIPQTIYFSRNETTIQQINDFRLAIGNDPLPIRPVNALGEKVLPAMRIGFYEAAAYCNWLSEQEGEPEDQWCYLPNEDGVMDRGMRIAHDHLERTGYQLPTPDLWEYACRAESETPRFFGIGIELAKNYSRWMAASGGSREAKILRKPNGYGLFDMLGNAAEWTVGVVAVTPNNMALPGRQPRFEPGQRDSPDGRRGPFQRPGSRPEPSLEGNGSARMGPRPGFKGRPEGQRLAGSSPGERGPQRGLGMAFGGGPELTDAAGKEIFPGDRFVVLGGAFDSPAHKIRSSDRSIISPPITNQPIGIRLMRILEH